MAAENDRISFPHTMHKCIIRTTYHAEQAKHKATPTKYSTNKSASRGCGFSIPL